MQVVFYVLPLRLRCAEWMLRSSQFESGLVWQAVKPRVNDWPPQGSARLYTRSPIRWMRCARDPDTGTFNARSSASEAVRRRNSNTPAMHGWHRVSQLPRSRASSLGVHRGSRSGGWSARGQNPAPVSASRSGDSVTDSASEATERRAGGVVSSCGYFFRVSRAISRGRTRRHQRERGGCAMGGWWQGGLGDGQVQ